MNGHRKPLGRNAPPDRRHIELYPLDALEQEAVPTNQAVPIGVNWYTNFDQPVQGSDGKWRVGKGRLGSVRGGHCFCLEQPGEPDPERNHIFYDQGEEGACEGFGNSRALALVEPGVPLLDGFWLYDDAQRIEGTYIPNGGSGEQGATNRGAAKALVKWGVHRESDEFTRVPQVIRRVKEHSGLHGLQITSYHWPTSVEQLLTVLGYDSSVTEVPFLNSWGKDGYPHRTFMPLEVVDRVVFKEEGEATVFVGVKQATAG